MLIEIPKTNYPGIYALVNLENGKCYVGKTKNLNQRITQHLEKLKRGQHENKTMQEDYNKNSIFKSVILEEFSYNVHPKELTQAEILYIGLYQSYKKEHGYNKNISRLSRDSIIKIVASGEINKLLNALEIEMEKTKKNLWAYQGQED